MNPLLKVPLCERCGRYLPVESVDTYGGEGDDGAAYTRIMISCVSSSCGWEKETST